MTKNAFIGVHFLNKFMYVILGNAQTLNDYFESF